MTAAAPAGEAASPSPPLLRQRLRSQEAPLALVFAGLLFLFPSEVVLAGPLRSNGAPARLVGMVALLLLGLDLLRRRRHDRAVAEPVVVLLLLYIAQALFFYGRSATALDDGDAANLRGLLFTFSACGVALYAAVRVRSTSTTHQVVGVLVAGCVLSAVIGILQAVNVPLVWSQVVRLPGMDYAGGTPGLGERFGLVRVLGTASHPIEFAVVLGCCLPLAVHLALHARTAQGRQAGVVAALVMTLALPFALSRGGLLCIATAVLVFLTVQSWQVRIATAGVAVVTGCVAYVLVPATYTAVVRLFTESGEDPSVAGRTDDFPLVDAAFNAAPWLGGAPLPDDLILDNQWFVVLVSRGMVGTAALVLLVLLPVLALLSTAWRVRHSDRRRQSLAAALAGSLLALAVSGGVFDLMAFGQAAMLMFLLVGLSAAVVLGPGQPGESASSASTARPLPSSTFPSPSSTDEGVSTSP